MSSPPSRDAPGFSVDTHLFRELGELLVARDSTALVELIKNAYDADSTLTRVIGEALADPDSGSILVEDNGLGMTEREFREGFLRIASRVKETQTRRSRRFERRFTGAKGVGRLAAHKLARRLEVRSVPDPEKLDPGEAPYQISAVIDWDAVETYETLEAAHKAVVFRQEPVSAESQGTTVALTRLRRAWSSAERQTFFDEVSSFDPPKRLTRSLKGNVLRTRLLFDEPRVRDASGSGMEVRLERDLASGDDPWDQFAAFANWVVEVDAGDQLQVAIAATVRGSAQHDYPVAPQFFTAPHAGSFPSDLRFQARAFIFEGVLPRAFRSALRRTSGIRVYLEGFRVLPYGEPGDDWLEVQRNYVVRKRALDLPSPFGQQVEDEALSSPQGDQVFGAVFLTEDQAPGLRLLVNREGFVASPDFHALQGALKTAIDLSTRVRAQASAERRRERAEVRRERREPDQAEPARVSADDLNQGLAAARAEATEARASVERGDQDTAIERLNAVLRNIDHSRVAGAELISERSMERVLASLGTQMAEFVHELAGILGTTTDLAEHARSLGADRKADPAEIEELADGIGELRRTIERQALLLVDVVAPDARRRRSRQKLRDRVDSAIAFVAQPAAARDVSLVNDVSSELLSPPMFPAELSTVLTNLLTNAVKAAGQGGLVQVSGRCDESGVVIRVENTGTAVEPSDGERWFAPFASTTTEVDSVLGQGMGLGLTLTRSMLIPYGASVSFVSPSSSFSAAVEVRFSD